MQLPFNEANVAKWRDEPKFTDSADFDPEFLQITRETKKKYFIERYEKPRELAAETHWRINLYLNNIYIHEHSM